MNFVSNIRKAFNWIHNNSTNQYLYMSSSRHVPYHEVTGYLIPTLRQWGFHDKAKSMADYLASIQKKDGSWEMEGVGGSDKNSYVFDTAQIVDGLSEYGVKYQDNIDKATTWILSKIDSNGKFSDSYVHPEIKWHVWLRTLYCLNKVGVDVSKYIELYRNNNELYKFDVLSHFYGYGFEAAARLGIECKPFIDEIVHNGGYIPEKKGFSTYCLTGLSQTSLALFLTNNFDLGMKNLEFVTKFQNSSGGFYGSNNGKYFPKEEISWAVKFYLDAFYEAQVSWFKNHIHIFFDSFDEEPQKDTRFAFFQSNINENEKVLDLGCGKGRYINNLKCDRYACDIADASKYINAPFKIGSCYNLPYNDGEFDTIIACECLEHSIFIDNAIAECLRVLKKGGKLLIVDKDKSVNFTGLHFGEEWLDFKYLANKYQAQTNMIVVKNAVYPFFTAKIIKG